LENRDFALGDMSRELAQLKEAAPLEWRREGMSVVASVACVLTASRIWTHLQLRHEDEPVMKSENS